MKSHFSSFSDVRLRKITEEKQDLQNEVQQLQQQLNDIKPRGRRSSSLNGVLDDDEYEDAQRKFQQVLHCLKLFKYLLFRRSQ